MMIQGTETEKNLAMSFAGECMARTRYTYYAEIAKKQGYHQIAAIFLETAENELAHAKYFFSALKQDGAAPCNVSTSVPLSGIGSTLENLKTAAAGEHEECTDLYPKFADIADKEGFPKIAAAYRMIAKIEKEHELRYAALAKRVEEGTVFKRDKKMQWKCRNCGYVHVGLSAPKVCPACFHPQGFFEIKETLE